MSGAFIVVNPLGSTFFPIGLGPPAAPHLFDPLFTQFNNAKSRRALNTEPARLDDLTPMRCPGSLTTMNLQCDAAAA